MNYRLTANNRSEFARERFDELVRGYGATDNISGLRALKINQAYTIYLHYLKVFNGSKPAHPSIYGRMEIFKKKRAQAEKKTNAIRNKVPLKH